MTTKRYRLLKDFLTHNNIIKAGMEVEYDTPNDTYESTGGYWFTREIVEHYKDWFQEIPDQPTEITIPGTIPKVLLDEMLKVCQSAVTTINKIKELKKSKSTPPSEPQEDKGWEVMAFKEEDGNIYNKPVDPPPYWYTLIEHIQNGSTLKTIHSVRRTSDNKVFTVGDVCSYDEKEWWPIVGFDIYDDKIGVLAEVTLNGGGKDNWRKCFLKSAKKKPISQSPTPNKQEDRIEVKVLPGSQYESHGKMYLSLLISNIAGSRVKLSVITQVLEDYLNK